MSSFESDLADAKAYVRAEYPTLYALAEAWVAEGELDPLRYEAMKAVSFLVANRFAETHGLS